MRKTNDLSSINLDAVKLSNGQNPSLPTKRAQGHGPSGIIYSMGLLEQEAQERMSYGEYPHRKLMRELGLLG